MWTVSRVVMMCIPRRLPQVIVLVGVLLFSAQMSRGKPFDPEIHTFSGQVKNSHAVIFVERGPEAGPTYRVLEVHKDDLQITKVGAEIRLDIESGIPAGGTGLILVADDDEGRHWNPWPLSRSGWEYVCMLPEGESTGAERAAHFAPYLAHDDQLIARDALFHASQLELPLVAKHVDDAMHVRMSELVAQDSTWPFQRNYLGFLLALIGNDDDRRVLRDVALRDSPDYRADAEGVFAGYLALAGEEGLLELEDKKLLNLDVHFSERFAVIKAVRFCAEYVPERIPRRRLGQTMLRATELPDFCDLAFAELIRMNEWSGIERVLPVYHSEMRQFPTVVRAMIRYVYIAAHPVHAKIEQPTADQQQQATELLEMFRDREPETYKEAFKFFPPAQNNTNGLPMTESTIRPGAGTATSRQEAVS